MTNPNQNPGQQNQNPGQKPGQQQQGGGQKPGQQQQDPGRQARCPRTASCGLNVQSESPPRRDFILWTLMHAGSRQKSRPD